VLVLVAIVVFVNLYFAVRILELTLRSHALIAGAQPSPEMPMLSIIVPARNEERQIEACVRSLLAQDYPHFEVIVVDDRSDDDTAGIVERLAGSDARLRLIRGEPLPEGWVGKPWALTQGSRVATGEWVLFTDADTTHAPSASASSIAYALREQIDVLSLLTDQTTVTLAERAVLPSILLAIAFAIGPIDDVNDPRKENAILNGQYILVRRAAYDALGGHAAVRGEIAEDYEFARLVKRDGRFRSVFAGSSGLVRTRMYRTFGELWEGFVKNFALGVRGRPAHAALGLTFFALLSPGSELVALACAVTGAWGAFIACVVGVVLTMLGAELAMRRIGMTRGSGAWLPLGMGVLSAIFVVSVVRHARGGVTWRGRTYRQGRSPGA
jgi:chlorobactene glucosyltransferase